MAKRTLKMTVRECPGCHQKFARLGKHAPHCPGNKTAATAAAREAKAEKDEAQKQAATNGRGRASSLHGPVTRIVSADYAKLVEVFAESSTKLADAFKALITERDHYKRERDEATDKMEKFRSALGALKL